MSIGSEGQQLVVVVGLEHETPVEMQDVRHGPRQFVDDRRSIRRSAQCQHQIAHVRQVFDLLAQPGLVVGVCQAAIRRGGGLWLAAEQGV